MADPVIVTVAATWRLSRVEMMLPYNSAMQSIMGYGEVLLQESSGETAAILKRRAVPSIREAEDGPLTYGAMPSDSVGRAITPELLAETIEIGGAPVSLEALMHGLAAFFDKWRVEDQENAPEIPLPQGEPLTPMHADPIIPEPLPPIDAPPPPSGVTN